MTHDFLSLDVGIYTSRDLLVISFTYCRFELQVLLHVLGNHDRVGRFWIGKQQTPSDGYEEM